MELALRRSFGYAFAPPLNRGIRGLGDCGDNSDPAYDAWCASGVDPNLAPVATGGSVYSQLIAAGVDPQDAAAYAGTPVTPVPSAIPTTLATSTGSPSTTTGLCPDGSPPWSDGTCVTCPDGSVPWSDGSCGTTPKTAGATPLTAVATAAATLAAAIAKAVNPTAGTTTCPAGYVYGAPGASVTISPGVATVGTGKCLPTTGVSTPLIAGVSNTTLAIVAFGFVALMMMGKKR